ncbi:hypothetical protein OIU79_024074 [Salix purpurea]|uniref:Uncharacterized protein n=1 Tax=Salix purpurea TaxID=77065 RepID=A0A9Q1A9R4_SALPP|nr:hypothetical protein OIU79_024074 [Salix purpurea]
MKIEKPKKRNPQRKKKNLPHHPPAAAAATVISFSLSAYTSLQPPSRPEAGIPTAPQVTADAATDDTRKRANDILSTEARHRDGGAIMGLKDAKERSRRS